MVPAPAPLLDAPAAAPAAADDSMLWLVMAAMATAAREGKRRQEERRGKAGGKVGEGATLNKKLDSSLIGSRISYYPMQAEAASI